MTSLSLLDSDDDSILLGSPSWSTRRKKAADKSRSNAMSYLDDAIDYSDKRHERQHRIKIKQEEEEPQEEVLFKAETLANEAASLTTSGAKRRRETNDEINGVLDEEDGMDYKRRVALAAATDTGRTTLLGVRDTLGVPNDDGVLYHSETDAVQKLKTCLKQIETKHRSHKSLRTSVIPPLNAAIRSDQLTLFLCHKSLSKLCAQHKLKEMPQEMIVWLYHVACSGGTGNMPLPLSIGAFDTLMALLKDNDMKTTKPIMALSDMIPQLEEWFGLCWDFSDIKAQSSSTDDTIATVHEKALGLGHFLRLWAMFLVNDNILSEAKKSNTTDTATQCLVALAMAGLDVTFQSGRRLLEPLQHVMQAIVAHVASKLDKDELVQWMDATVDRILEQCPSLGPGAPKSEDEDDPQAWLCYSLMVRQCPVQSPQCAEFKARMAIRALQTCLDIEDWDSQVKTILQEKDSNAPLVERSTQSLKWRAIVSAYVGLVTIDRLGKKVAMDGPRCLSTVENAFYCVQAGTFLFSSELQEDSSGELPSEDDGGLYGSPEDAHAMYQVLELLENECTQLNKHVRSMSSRPHFRRMECHLACLRGYYRHCKVEAGVMADHVAESSGVKVQKSLDDWFGSRDDSDDDESPSPAQATSTSPSQ